MPLRKPRFSSTGLTERPREKIMAPQVSQVSGAALVKRKAVTMPLDHAFRFELADIRAAAIEMLC
jgi:hypothetical protein